MVGHADPALARAAQDLMAKVAETVPERLRPMIGGVFGDTTGIAPGYKGSLTWRKLELYSEGEYVFDTGSTSDSFFYNWSELTLAPVEWFRFGLVTQRTRVYKTDRDTQRGHSVDPARVEIVLVDDPRPRGDGAQRDRRAACQPRAGGERAERDQDERDGDERDREVQLDERA